MISLTIWMNMPSHHQAGLFAALRRCDVDLQVNYYGGVTRQRQLHGWADVRILPLGERFVRPAISEVHAIPDWRERVHVVPGYGTRFTRNLVREFFRRHVAWLHWSEGAHPGYRWWASYPMKNWYARKVNATALAALAIGDLAERDFIRWGIDQEKIEFLPYSGLPPPQTASIDRRISAFCGEGNPLFLYVGALNRRKGIDLLLKAFAVAVRHHPGARLLLVGRDESGGGYSKLLCRLKLAGQVLLPGPVDFSRLGAIISSVDVLVLPSRHDGWGMVLAEGAAFGKALIGSDACGATTHLIRHNWNGFSVPAGDTLALALALERYADEPALARVHGQRSVELYSEFTPDRNAQRMLEIIGRRLQSRSEGNLRSAAG